VAQAAYPLPYFSSKAIDMTDIQNKNYIIALDQGTTSSRAIIFDRDANVVCTAQREFAQHYPQAGWVEHDPMEIFATQSAVMVEALAQAGLHHDQVAAIGITNQRETTVVWDKVTGRPIYNAIVWQCRRSTEICQQLKRDGHEQYISDTTGLVTDPYFSGTKLKWILDNVEGSRERARNGELLFGTIDSWLIWKFTGGKTHVTDYTNASRTMLFNIHTLEWDAKMLDILDVPREMLPEVKSSSEIYGRTKSGIAIGGIAGDQQAALFGEGCFAPGDVKCTHGTGSFLDMNVGSKPAASLHGLLPMVAWKTKDETAFMLEGFIPATGALIAWLKDGLGLIQDVAESETLAKSVPDSGGVVAVPALGGLGAPYWDPNARGTVLGMTLATQKAHVVRAFLEGIAFECRDILLAMQKDAKLQIRTVISDGGASKNDFFLEGMASTLGVEVQRPVMLEATALGSAFLAGLSVGFWRSKEELLRLRRIERTFSPFLDVKERQRRIQRWKRALKRSKGWTRYA